MRAGSRGRSADCSLAAAPPLVVGQRKERKKRAKQGKEESDARDKHCQSKKGGRDHVKIKKKAHYEREKSKNSGESTSVKATGKEYCARSLAANFE